MSDYLANGRIADLILALLLLEAIGLLAYHRLTGRGVGPAQLLPNVLAGACLVLALRGALVGAAWPWIALCLGAALCAHAFDFRRWTRG